MTGIVQLIEDIVKSEKNYIIEGFPKNLRQALLLQKSKIYVQNVLIINVDDRGLYELCSEKINRLNPSANEQERNHLIQAAMVAHKMYCPLYVEI